MNWLESHLAKKPTYPGSVENLPSRFGPGWYFRPIFGAEIPRDVVLGPYPTIEAALEHGQVQAALYRVEMDSEPLSRKMFLESLGI